MGYSMSETFACAQVLLVELENFTARDTASAVRKRYESEILDTIRGLCHQRQHTTGNIRSETSAYLKSLIRAYRNLVALDEKVQMEAIEEHDTVYNNRW